MTSYYGCLDPRAIFRAGADGGNSWHRADPETAEWSEVEAPDSEWSAANLVEISRDEALLVLVAWQGVPDDLDADEPAASRSEELPHLAAVAPIEDPPEDHTPPVPASAFDIDLASDPVATGAAEEYRVPVSPPIVLEPEPEPAKAPALVASFDVWTEPAPVIEIPRREALSALRDLATELTSLGQPGLSWG